jgi:hypothetical protein
MSNSFISKVLFLDAVNATVYTEIYSMAKNYNYKVEDLLIKTAREHDVSLSALYCMSKGLSEISIAKLCGNVEILPKYIKSRVSP